MEEYLFKYNDQYTLVELSKEDAGSNPEQYIEVPEGAEIYTKHETDENVFYKKGLEFLDHWDNKWLPTKYHTEGFAVEMKCNGRLVVWQRETLNDKVATADAVKQNEKHSHYKKDVSHLSMIDPYRIADLYALHPCADHIMKKSLCAGNRGYKDTLLDIQDIIDTAERWKQMIEEDNSEI